MSVAVSGPTVAINVTLSPSVTVAVVWSNVTLSTGTTAAATVISQVALLSPAFAVIVTVPSFNVVTTPSATVATVSSDDVHVTVLSAPAGFTVAVNVTLSPAVTDAVVWSNVTLSTGTTAAATVISQVALWSPAVAVMVTVPSFNVVTTPSATVATVSSDDVHVTVLSVAVSGVTVAVNVTLSPAVTDAVALSNVTLSTGTTAAVTVTLQVALFPPAVAVMVASPSATAVTLPVSSTVATDSLSDDHATAVPLGVTVEINVSVFPSSKLILDLSNEIYSPVTE